MIKKDRLGIFVFYDKEGIVDDYIIYLLKDLIKNLKKLVVVCNGSLSEIGKEKFKEITPHVITRENEGYDAGAYKFVIEEYLGQNEINQYDELVLCNDTFYGPFWAFSNYFEHMEKNYPNVDFWGMTVHSRANDAWVDRETGYIPEHIQSFFIVIRSSMLHSDSFYSFWQTLQTKANEVTQIIENFEVRFTQYFVDNDFKWAVYADTRNRDRMNNNTFIINHSILSCDTLIKDYHCPLIKRRCFTWHKMLEWTDNGNTIRALEYIQNNTNYDVSLIYRHLLRTTNLAQLKQNLSWNYILPKDRILDSYLPTYKTLIIVHEHHLNESIQKYLKIIPKGIDILITTNYMDTVISKTLEEQYFQSQSHFLGIEVIKEPSSFLFELGHLIKNYEYVCFMPDIEFNSKDVNITVTENLHDLIVENMLASEKYIHNILFTFEKNPNLGILVPPLPYHGSYINEIARGWNADYKCCVEFLKKLGVKAPISENYSPLSFGTSLWFRTAALQPILNNDLKNKLNLSENEVFKHGIERSFPYIAQSQGYYTGWVMTKDYASLYLEQFYQCYAIIAKECNELTHSGQPIADFFNLVLALKTYIQVTLERLEKAEGSVYGNNPATIKAAEIAMKQDSESVNQICLRDALDVFWISIDVWKKKHSIHPALRRQASEMNIPGIKLSLWLVKQALKK